MVIFHIADLPGLSPRLGSSGHIGAVVVRWRFLPLVLRMPGVTLVTDSAGSSPFFHA